MAKQKITGLSASLLETASAGQSTPGSELTAELRPIVQTVKVPPDIFVRLKTVGAKERRTSQDIILSALCEYLDRLAAPQGVPEQPN